MSSLSDQLLVPVSSLYDTQKYMDDRTLSELKSHASETCLMTVDRQVVEIPRLLLTGVRNTYITAARVTLDFQSTAIRILPHASSVTLNIQSDPVPNLGEMLAETVTGKP
jgi:hypothetical protein